MDDVLPMRILEATEYSLIMIGIFTQVIIINWWMIFPFSIVGYLYWSIRSTYIPTAQGIKRLEGSSKTILRTLYLWALQSRDSRDLFFFLSKESCLFPREFDDFWTADNSLFSSSGRRQSAIRRLSRYPHIGVFPVGRDRLGIRILARRGDERVGGIGHVQFRYSRQQ